MRLLLSLDLLEYFVDVEVQSQNFQVHPVLFLNDFVQKHYIVEDSFVHEFSGVLPSFEIHSSHGVRARLILRDLMYWHSELFASSFNRME